MISFRIEKIKHKRIAPRACKSTRNTKKLPTEAYQGDARDYGRESHGLADEVRLVEELRAEEKRDDDGESPE